MTKIKSFGARASRFFRDNFLILALVVLALWFLLIWLLFKDSPTQLQAYAIFGTALATAVLAFATFFMARSSKQMAQEIRYERGQSRAVEFVGMVIDPVIERIKEVRSSIEERKLQWERWPKKERAEMVLEEPNLKRFQIGGTEEPSYFLPYPDVEIMEEIHLTASRFEWRRQREFIERYGQLTQQIEEYDELARDFRRLLGGKAVKIDSCLSKSRIFKTLGVGLRPYIVGLAFNQVIWSEEKFSGFLSHFGINNEREQARVFYSEKVSSIKRVLKSEGPKILIQLDAECSKLTNTLVRIEIQLANVRKKLCDEYLISESVVDSLRESRNHF